MDAGDRDLVRQACAGDHGAFRQLVDRHGRRLYQMAYRMTGNHADAEDVVQDAFVKAFRQLHQFESRASFSTWLYRIGVNCAIDVTGRGARREAPEEPARLDARHHPRVVDADARVYAREISGQLGAAMEELTAQERAAFIMRHCDDCSIEEIGQALGLNVSAAKHSVFRAVRKLRIALRPLAEAEWGIRS